jgi:hypothetical protein
MRRSLSPLHWSTPEPAPAQNCASPNTFDCLSAADSFDSSSLSNCRIFSDAPSVRGYVDSQSGLQGSKDLSSVSSATLTKERHYASKPSPTAHFVSLRRNLASTWQATRTWVRPVRSFIGSQQFPDYTFGHQRARPTPIREFRFMRWHPGDVMTSSSAAPQPHF